jgi:multidrug efflux pump
MAHLLYRNIRLLILTIGFILVLGLSALQVLPRMEDPQLTPRLAFITTSFPGATANRVEALITKKIEQELFEIPEIQTIRSTSTLGLSTIFVELKDEMTSNHSIESQIRDKLADVIPQLPPGALEPEYEEIDTRAYTLITALTWELDSPVNYAILNRLAEELESQLRQLPGTEKIELSGNPTEEIVVEINPTDLAALGLTPQELSQHIQASDAKVTAGQLRSRNTLLIELEAQLDSLEQIRQIPIRCPSCGVTEGNGGQFTRLGDIAQVHKGIAEPITEEVLIQRQPAVVLAILMEANQRVDQWTTTTRQTLTAFKQQLPRGIGLQVIFDQSHYVDHRLNELLNNLLLGILFVVISTFVMMGWKSAIVVSSALPLSILMVLGGMRLLNIPLHQMSITGLVIALGMLIDNAIIVVDQVQNELKSGIKPQAAITKTIRHLTAPLLASTLTTILGFMPILLLPGNVGEFVRDIALSVILALSSSLLLCLSVIPALTVRFGSIQPSEGLNARKWWRTGIHFGLLTPIYRRLLNRMLAKPVLSILLTLILPITGFFVAPTLEEQFFPPVERDQVSIELELMSQTSLEQTRSFALQVNDRILGHPQVKEIYWFLGGDAPRFYYNLRSDRAGLPYYAHGMIQLSSATGSQALIQTLQTELDQAFPQAGILVKQLEQGPPIGAPIELRLYGPDLAILQELGHRVRRELAAVASVTHTNATLSASQPKLGLRVDVEQARLAGLNPTLIAQQLEANLEGRLGGTVLEETQELPVRVRLSNPDRGDLNQIASLELLPETSLQRNHNPTPLSAVSEMALQPEQAMIFRYNGQRLNTVVGFIEAGTLPSNVLKALKQRLTESGFQLPPGYSLEIGGEAAERNQAIGNLVSTVGILVFLMIATLVLLLGSFRSAGIIVLVALCSIGLGLAALWIFGYPLGFMSILGIVGLIGVAINDSIMILAALCSDSLAATGNRQAMVNEIIHSTRHVLTTTITTLAGFLPLWLNGGAFWPPLAVCIAGGVGGATLLALSWVPCTYLLLKKAMIRH